MKSIKTRIFCSDKTLCRQIIDHLILIPSPTKGDLNRVKMDICQKLGVPLPKNFEIMAFLNPEESNLLKILDVKPIRSISGVNVVAVMTMPSSCPHGKCAYCPGGPEYNVPSSYTGYEPATMRGIQNQFDPYLQVKNRIDQLKAIGHKVSKIELIIMGGTFPSTSSIYQESFVKGCLDAIAETNSNSLAEAQLNNEQSIMRNVGITVENRPDCCKESQVDKMLELGVTKVELGVQNLYDDIYRLVERGHTVQDVIDATRVLRDSGLKVCYHMMPGLPGSNFKRDLNAFNKLFSNPNFMPDMLKIYPCLVIQGTKIYDWWEKSEYKPYTVEEAIDLIVKIKESVPPWVRIMRVQRDIPAQLIVAGIKKGNLRELVRDEMRKHGLKCHCIRCREVGHRMLLDGESPNIEDIKIVTRKYDAAYSSETFISVEDTKKDILIGYIRLRFPSLKAHRPEIKANETSIVRELHIYGPLVPVGTRSTYAWQHHGYGETLLKEAERVASENGKTRMIVTSALGVREYFKRLGYRRIGPYMGKDINRFT